MSLNLEDKSLVTSDTNWLRASCAECDWSGPGVDTVPSLVTKQSLSVWAGARDYAKLVLVTVLPPSPSLGSKEIVNTLNFLELGLQTYNH